LSVILAKTLRRKFRLLYQTKPNSRKLFYTHASSQRVSLLFVTINLCPFAVVFTDFAISNVVIFHCRSLLNLYNFDRLKIAFNNAFTLYSAIKNTAGNVK